MDAFLQFVLGGLVTGAVLSLVAIGWVLIYNVSGILNLAQGEFVMIGALTFIRLHREYEWPLVFAIPVSIAITAVVGVILDAVVLRRLKRDDLVPMVLVTVGASFVLREIAKEIFGKEPLRTPPLIQGDPIEIGGAFVVPHTFLLWITVVLLVIGLSVFFGRTLVGKAMRACSENPLGARTVGISTLRMRTVAFGISAGLGAIAGILIVPLTAMSWSDGTFIGIKGFIAAVFGGFGSLIGAVLGAVLIGLFEALSAGYISSSYKDVFSTGALLLVLLLRPQGILGSSLRNERQAGSLRAVSRWRLRSNRSQTPHQQLAAPQQDGSAAAEESTAVPT